MQCLAVVTFLPGCSLPPEEFSKHLKHRWTWIENTADIHIPKPNFNETHHSLPAKFTVFIADYESVEQMAMDLAIIPGAGISSIEILPVSYGSKYHVQSVRRKTVTLPPETLSSS